MKPRTPHLLPFLALTTLLLCTAGSGKALGQVPGSNGQYANYYKSLYYRGGYSYFDNGPIYRFLFLADPNYTPYFPYSPKMVEVVKRPFQRQPRMIEAEVQVRLAKLGYYRGAIDGLVGAETQLAIRAYQRARGLPMTGQMDMTLLRCLRLI